MFFPDPYSWSSADHRSSASPTETHRRTTTSATADQDCWWTGATATTADDIGNISGQFSTPHGHSGDEATNHRNCKGKLSQFSTRMGQVLDEESHINLFSSWQPLDNLLPVGTRRWWHRPLHQLGQPDPRRRPRPSLFDGIASTAAGPRPGRPDHQTGLPERPVPSHADREDCATRRRDNHPAWPADHSHWEQAVHCVVARCCPTASRGGQSGSSGLRERDDLRDVHCFNRRLSLIRICVGFAASHRADFEWQAHCSVATGIAERGNSEFAKRQDCSVAAKLGSR